VNGLSKPISKYSWKDSDPYQFEEKEIDSGKFKPISRGKIYFCSELLKLSTAAQNSRVNRKCNSI